MKYPKHSSIKPKLCYINSCVNVGMMDGLLIVSSAMLVPWVWYDLHMWCRKIDGNKVMLNDDWLTRCAPYLWGHSCNAILAWLLWCRHYNMPNVVRIKQLVSQRIVADPFRFKRACLRWCLMWFWSPTLQICSHVKLFGNGVKLMEFDVMYIV